MSNNQPIPTTTIVPERQQKPGTSISDLGSEGAGRDEKDVRVGTERENQPTGTLEGRNQAMAERQGNHLSCTDPACHCHPWECERQEQVHKSGDEVRYHGRVFQFSHYLYDKPDADMAIIYRGNDRTLVKVGDLKPTPTGHDERCVPACPCRQWVAATPLDDEANAALHHALDLIGVEAVRGRIAPTNDDETTCAAIDSVLAGEDLAVRLEEGERLRRVERRVNTSDYHAAPSGIGPLAKEWIDKPHRLVYDLTDEVERLRDGEHATLNLLRTIEQRIQLAHRERDPETCRLQLVALKGIVNRAIADRMEQQ